MVSVPSAEKGSQCPSLSPWLIGCWYTSPPHRGWRWDLPGSRGLPSEHIRHVSITVPLQSSLTHKLKTPLDHSSSSSSELCRLLWAIRCHRTCQWLQGTTHRHLLKARYQLQALSCGWTPPPTRAASVHIVHLGLIWGHRDFWPRTSDNNAFEEITQKQN